MIHGFFGMGALFHRGDDAVSDVAKAVRAALPATSGGA
jgi:hypothetical protein